MKYREIADGIFVDRPNRFIAHVGVNGAVETVHVKNTGRCRELLLPGTAVRLEVSDNPKRKTKYDLVAVHKQGLGWVNMDSQAPNKIVGEWLAKQGYDYIKPEFTYGKSRIDFYMEKGEQKYLLEVKGCTLEVDGIGYFPDAPTERGVKHVYPDTPISSEYLALILKHKCRAEARATVLGYTQRGRHPSAYDSWFAFEAGTLAVNLLRNGIGNQVIGIKDGRVFYMPIDMALQQKREFDLALYNLVNEL